MKYIKFFESYIKESAKGGEDIVFVRYDMFDNKKAKRKFPRKYDGVHAWAIRRKDYQLYVDNIKFDGGNENYIRIIEPTEDATILAFDFNRVNDYIVGWTDDFPKAELFDLEKHTLKYRHSTEKEKADSLYYYNTNLPDFIPDRPYQLVFRNYTDRRD